MKTEKKSFTIDIEGVHSRLLRNYNSLCKKLNGGVYKNWHGEWVRLPSNDIKEELDSLRSDIVILAGTGIKGVYDPVEFPKEVFTYEPYPEDEEE